MELSVWIPEEHASELRRQLIEKFGRSRLAEDIDKIIAKVLKTKRIASDADAELIKNRLGDQMHPAFGTEQYLELGRIFASYGETKRPGK